METRKVQVTGGSTFTVSLPKEWAEENGVSAGSVVELFHRGETLLMKPKTTRESEPGELALPETKIQHANGTALRLEQALEQYPDGHDLRVIATASPNSTPTS